MTMQSESTNNYSLVQAYASAVVDWREKHSPRSIQLFTNKAGRIANACSTSSTRSRGRAKLARQDLGRSHSPLNNPTHRHRRVLFTYLRLSSVELGQVCTTVPCLTWIGLHWHCHGLLYRNYSWRQSVSTRRRHPCMIEWARCVCVPNSVYTLAPKCELKIAWYRGTPTRCWGDMA